MTGREHRFERERIPAAVRLILQSLTPLVLDDVALVIELLDVGRVEQRREAIGLEPQDVLEIAGRHGREVVRAIAAGRAVDAAFLQVGAGALDVGEIFLAGVLRALEHHVLEQVREAGAPLLLVLRSDVIPLIHVDDRQLPIDVQDHLQSVRQRVLLERHLRRLDAVAAARGAGLAGAGFSARLVGRGGFACAGGGRLRAGLGLFNFKVLRGGQRAAQTHTERHHQQT